MMKAKTKRILAAVMSAAILASVTAAAIPSASAVSTNQSEGQQTSPYLIDYSKTASLTLYKYEMSDVSKATEGSNGEQTDKIPEGATPLADVTFTVTKVAELKDCIDNGKLSIPSLEEAAKAVQTSTEVYTATTDTTGVAKLENLPLGIYYVQETKSPSQVVKKIAPFVLTLPLTNSDGTKWLYDVYSYPKNQTSYGSAILQKVDSVDNKTIDGAKFDLQYSTDNTNYQTFMPDIVTGSDGTATIDNLPSQCYYRFVETEAPDEKYIVDSTKYYEFYIDAAGNMVRDDSVVADSTVKVENDYPLIHKYILDGEKGTKGIDNTANIGDTVYWEINTSIPYEIGDMTTYTITDTMSKGLKYTGAELYLDNKTKLTEGTDYTVSEDGLNVSFAIDTKKLTSYSEVELYFNTELTSEAELAVDIPNTSKLTYTNNIGTESTYQVTSETPTVHTGGYSFYKVDESRKGLQGATFALYRTKEDFNNGATPVATQQSDENGVVTFSGLAYGSFSRTEDEKAQGGVENGETTYWLVETQAPAGYALHAEPIEIKVNKTSHIASNNVEIVNSLVPDMPKTGAVQSALWLLGIVIALAGGAMFILTTRNKTKE